MGAEGHGRKILTSDARDFVLEKFIKDFAASLGLNPRWNRSKSFVRGEDLRETERARVYLRFDSQE